MAEIVEDAEISYILIAINLLSVARLGRLNAMQKRVTLKMCADSLLSLTTYAQAAQHAGRTLEVLILCDTG